MIPAADHSNRRLLKIINLVYFFALLALGIYFGKERAVFCDSATQLYDMASRGFPRVNPSMATTVINFILPYLAIAAGWSAKAMVYAQALNYLLLTVAAFLFLRWRQQSLKYETGFLVAFTLFNWQTFYYPIHDYWTGFYLLFILYRVVDDPALQLKPKAKIMGELALIAMMMFTHLSIVISLGFFYLYLFLEKTIDLKHIARAYGFILFVFVFKVVFVNSGYQNTLINPSEIFAAGLNWDTPSIREFFPTLIRSNANFLFLFALTAVVCIYLRRFYSAALLVLIMVCSLAVINLLFGQYGYSVYTEGYFKSLNIVCGIIMANVLLALVSREKSWAFAFALNFIFSAAVLFMGGRYFNKQYTFVKESCKKFDTNVYLNSQKNICPLECLAISRQSILINQVENGRNTCIFANIRNEWYVDALNHFWIEKNREKSVHNFTFPEEMVYLDADSMKFPVDSFAVLFFNRPCDDMIKRLSSKPG